MSGRLLCLFFLCVFIIQVQAQSRPTSKVFYTLEKKYPGLPQDKIKLENSEFAIRADFRYENNDYKVYFEKGLDTTLSSIYIEHQEEIPLAVEQDISLRTTKHKTIAWDEKIDYEYSVHEHIFSIETEDDIFPYSDVYIGLAYDTTFRFNGHLYSEDKDRKKVISIFMNPCRFTHLFLKRDSTLSFIGEPKNFFFDSIRTHMSLKPQELTHFDGETYKIFMEVRNQQMRVLIFGAPPLTLRNQIEPYLKNIKYLEDGCCWIEVHIDRYKGIMLKQFDPDAE